MNKIIAVVGMCGSGKSVLCEYLEKKNYQKVYFGGVTMDKLKEENILVTPDNEKMMRERLRSEYGMGAYAIILLPKIKELLYNGDVVLDGLYSWDELMIIKKEIPELITISMICDKKLRYERLSKRVIRPFNYEDAVKRDLTEIENIRKAGPIAYADYYIFNNGNVEDVYNRMDEIFMEMSDTDE